MSTAFAIVLAVAVAVATSLGGGLIAPVLLNLMELSNSGGPILFALIIAGLVGFQLYVGTYIGLRVFRKSNITAVGYVLGTLALIGVGVNSVSQWNSEGGHWMIVFGGGVGLVSSWVGIAAAGSTASEDRAPIDGST